MYNSRAIKLCHICHIMTLWKIHKKCFSYTSMRMKRLFESSEHANIYSVYRPVYPPHVLQSIIEFYKRENDEFCSALDIGCGSGQSTMGLSKYFTTVTGIDVSEAQIAQTPKSEKNIKFIVGQAEDLYFCKNNTINLISVAQSMHWIDTDKFYHEAKRVLKTNGVLAVYGYGKLALDNSEANNLVSDEFYGNLLMKGGYWDVNRQYVDDLYRSFNLPFRDFCRFDHMKMEKEWSIPEFIGYINTWSGYRAYMKKNPDSKILQDINEKLISIYQDNHKGEVKMKVTWPIFVLLGRN